MKHLIIYFTLCLLTLSCSKKDENIDLKYEFLNQQIAENQKKDSMFFKLFDMPDKKYIYSISSNKNIFDDIKDEDSIFSIDDKNYIHQQIKDSIDFQRDRNKLRFNSTEIMSESDQKQLEKMKGAENFWTFFRKKFPNRCIRNISNPVFNLRKDILVVSISEYCGGEFGGGGIYIFKRINGKWKSIKTLRKWVS